MERDSARGAIQPGLKILARFAQTGLGFSARANGPENLKNSHVIETELQPGLNSELGHAQWFCLPGNKMANISAQAEVRHVIATKFQPGWRGWNFSPGWHSPYNQALSAYHFKCATIQYFKKGALGILLAVVWRHRVMAIGKLPQFPIYLFSFLKFSIRLDFKEFIVLK